MEQKETQKQEEVLDTMESDTAEIEEDTELENEGDVEEKEEKEVEEEVDEEVDELSKAQEEVALYKDRWMRLAAEFDNYKKRTAREFSTLVQSASEDVIRDLLPILDAVGRALDHSEEGDAESEGFQEGVKMIMEQFPRVLHNRNLKEIETVGQPFDPNVHEALMQMPSETYDVGLVADVVENGYRLGDKVLRPAKVVVSQGKPEDVSVDKN